MRDILHELADEIRRAPAEIIVVIGDAVLAVGAVDEDVPRDNAEVDVAVFGVAHHLPPERDLLVNRHLLDRFETAENLGAVEPLARQVIIFFPLNG